MTVEQLAKHHAMTNYARAEKQSIEDASYIQDVAYYSFIEGYKAASSNTGDGLEIIKFGMFLTGHGEGDINQMYNDWKNSQQ